MNITKLLQVCIVVILSVSSLSGQSKSFKAGIEVQGYPTGMISGLRGDLFVDEFWNFNLRLGYNLVRHGSAGEHDDERGGGFGFSLGAGVLPFANHRWITGVRTDLWFNTIDWSDTDPVMTTGTTKVTVLQPTAIVGFRIPVTERIELMPTAGFGYEFNVRTVGAEVGQGAIGLLGIVLNTDLRSIQGHSRN